MFGDCPAPYVVDGDSLRCGHERLRLLGIDAPELHGCPKWRRCVGGDGEASKRSLAAALKLGPFRYRVMMHDRFGRSVVAAWASSTNLSCWQIGRSHAVYKPRWDENEIDPALVPLECTLGRLPRLHWRKNFTCDDVSDPQRSAPSKVRACRNNPEA